MELGIYLYTYIYILNHTKSHNNLKKLLSENEFCASIALSMLFMRFYWK
jgi:hypothetical protein